MTITQAYAPTVIDRLNAEWAVRYADVPHAWPHGGSSPMKWCSG